jgi:hypothetical protein
MMSVEALLRAMARRTEALGVLGRMYERSITMSWATWWRVVAI